MPACTSVALSLHPGDSIGEVPELPVLSGALLPLPDAVPGLSGIGVGRLWGDGEVS